MVSTYTQNLLLENPTPADPATNNVWGTTENTGRTLVDSAVAGILTLSVAGAVNITLTSTQGAADQSRNAHFVFTGVLTGNVIVLYPNGKTRTFSAINSTTGAFTLSVGVSNGGGAAAGTTVAIPASGTMEFVSDGTNVTQRITALTSPAITTPTITTGTLTNPTTNKVLFSGSSSGTATVQAVPIAGTPTLLLPPAGSGFGSILGKSGAAVSCPANTSENVLATITVPANSVGANGVIAYVLNVVTTASTNLRTLRVRFSGAAGTVVVNFPLNSSSTANQRVVGEMVAANAANSQVWNSLRFDGAANVGQDLEGTSAIDTTLATTISVSGEKSVAGETFTLKNFYFLLYADAA